MANILSRWLAVRALDRAGGVSAARSSSMDDLAAQIAQIERRLRHEAPIDLETPSRRLRTRTMNALHEAALHDAPRFHRRYRRRFVWWRTPQFRAGLTACGVVLGSALTAALMFTEPPHRTVKSAAPDDMRLAQQETRADDEVNQMTGAEGLTDSSDEILTALGESWQRELDAVASDARRAADFIVSQFPLRHLIPSDAPVAAHRQPAPPPRKNEPKKDPSSLDL